MSKELPTGYNEYNLELKIKKLSEEIENAKKSLERLKEHRIRRIEKLEGDLFRYKSMRDGYEKKRISNE